MTGQAGNSDEKDIDIQGGSSSKPAISVILLVVICILYLGIAILFYFQIANVKTYNEKFMYLNMWQADSRIRKSYVAQLCLWISQAIIITNKYVNGSNFTNFDIMKGLIEDDLALLDDATKKMLDDSPDNPSPIGISKTIDRFTLQALCTMNQNTNSLHEEYRCGSLQNQLSFF